MPPTSVPELTEAELSTAAERLHARERELLLEMGTTVLRGLELDPDRYWELERLRLHLEGVYSAMRLRTPT